MSVDDARDGGPGRRVAIVLAAGLAAGLALVLLWPDGEAVRQACCASTCSSCTAGCRRR